MNDDQALGSRTRAFELKARLQLRDLIKLLPLLSHQEIRDLKQEIRELKEALEAVDMRLDIIAQLPIELRIHIAQYIDLAEIYKLLIVSRRWRELWCETQLFANLTRRTELRGFREFYTDVERVTGVKQDVQHHFYQAVRRLNSKKEGNCRVMSCEFRDAYVNEKVPLDPVLHPPGNFDDCNLLLHSQETYSLGGHNFFFSNGRLAWALLEAKAPDNSLILVEDMRQRVRKIFRIPQVLVKGGVATIEALGDQLVVAYFSRSLYAWDLAKSRHERVSVPSKPLSCKSRGENVYVLCEDRVVYIWKFGGSIEQLAIFDDGGGVTGSGGDPRGPRPVLDLALHPVRERTIYIVESGDPLCRLVTYENGMRHEELTVDFAGCGMKWRDHTVAAPVSAYGHFGVGKFCHLHPETEGPVTRWTMGWVVFDPWSQRFYVSAHACRPLGNAYGTQWRGYWNKNWSLGPSLDGGKESDPMTHHPAIELPEKGLVSGSSIASWLSNNHLESNQASEVIYHLVTDGWQVYDDDEFRVLVHKGAYLAYQY